MRKIEQQVNAYLKYCKEICQMSETTLNLKRNILQRFVKESHTNDLGQMSNIIYNTWAAQELKRGIAPATMNIYNSALLSFVKYYRDSGMNIPLNLNLIPRYKNHMATPRKFYTHMEIVKVLKIATPSERLMIKMMFETGLRIHEIVSLQLSNFTGAKIAFIGKGHKNREVYLAPATLEELNDYINIYNIQHGYLWQAFLGVKSVNGEPPAVDTVRKRLQSVFAAAGLDGFYPHALRHSFATNLQHKGATIAEIKEMMGHTNITTTERYLHGFDNSLEALFRKYQ